ncbi:hypothetical protein CHS0354_039290 [Potamilus streckersoni]|uniref:RING-type domain-containing protein n=1 Tax=Potamilus streckersoni TaxID=2493646 RepID=A0AAE0RMP1_9BIVA|nr:hypothetical protein CHS0354_039290 [Potamilus streckersoni]
MEEPTESNMVTINLKKANKNHRMDMCCRYFDPIENGLIIVSRFFGTITYVSFAQSDLRDKEHLQNNNYRKFSSVSQCLYSLDQNKRNIIIACDKTLYLTDTEKSLASVLLHKVPIVHGTLFQLEFDASKTGIMEKKNCASDLKIRSSLEKSEIIQQVKNQVKRRNNRSHGLLTLQPREQNIEAVYLARNIPVYRVQHNSPPLMDVIASINDSSLNGGELLYGEVVQDCAGSNSLTVSTTTRRQSFLQTDGGENAEHLDTMREISSGRISAGESLSNTNNNGGATGRASLPVLTDKAHIRSPQYQVYSVRLLTFSKWPASITQKPEQVATAGFYYTGLNDVVRCFACDGGLKNWDPEDDPWIEHARWFPQCPYVQEVKGREFVDLVKRMTEESDEEEDAVVHSTFQRNNPMAHPPDLQQLSLGNDTDEPSQLETDAAQIVLQTGYPKNAVAVAIDALICKGKRKYTAQDIMEVILEKEEKGDSLPTDGNSQSHHIPFQDFRSTPSVNEENDTESDYEDIQRIIKENESMKSIITCMKCKVQAKNILFLPCTHHCLCHLCAEKCSLCPVCYKIIKQKIKTFMI